MAGCQRGTGVFITAVRNEEPSHVVKPSDGVPVPQEVTKQMNHRLFAGWKCSRIKKQGVCSYYMMATQMQANDEYQTSVLVLSDDGALRLGVNSEGPGSAWVNDRMDLDGDGHRDWVIGTFVNRDHEVRYYACKTYPRFKMLGSVEVKQKDDASFADLDGDGRKEIVVQQQLGPETMSECPGLDDVLAGLTIVYSLKGGLYEDATKRYPALIDRRIREAESRLHSTEASDRLGAAATCVMNASSLGRTDDELKQIAKSLSKPEAERVANEREGLCGIARDARKEILSTSATTWF